MDIFYITGTSRGLGKALALALLKDDRVHVIGMGRQGTLSHERYRHISLDLRDTKAVADMAFVLPGSAERAVLINNAGVIAPVGPVGRLDNQALADGFQVNLVGPAILMNNFIRDTRNREAERLIVNISSGAARHTIDAWSGYCAGKAGLDMFSEVLHSEQAVYNADQPVRILSIAPGVVDTGMQQQIRAVSEKDFAGKDRFVRMRQDGQLAAPESTAAVIVKMINAADTYTRVCLDVRTDG